MNEGQSHPTRNVSSNSLSPETAMNIKFESVAVPKKDDILCGKNKECIKHEGSQDFRRIVESYTVQYQQAKSRQAKMDVTKTIFDSLQSRRFLKFNDETGMWETLHPLAVRDKIGHALRFSNRRGGSTIRSKVRMGSNPDLVGSLALNESPGSLANDLLLRRSTGNLLGMSSRKSLSKQSFSKLRDLQSRASGQNFSSHQNAQWHNGTSSQRNAQWGDAKKPPSRLNNNSLLNQHSASLMNAQSATGLLNAQQVNELNSQLFSLPNIASLRLSSATPPISESSPHMRPLPDDMEPTPLPEPRAMSVPSLDSFSNQTNVCQLPQWSLNNCSNDIQGNIHVADDGNDCTSAFVSATNDRNQLPDLAEHALAPHISDGKDDDLTWMLQVPIMELNQDGDLTFS